jgi:hypothetical protein
VYRSRKHDWATWSIPQGQVLAANDKVPHPRSCPAALRAGTRHLLGSVYIDR